MTAVLVNPKEQKIKIDETFLALIKETEGHIGYQLPQSARDMLKIFFNEGYLLAANEITPLALKALEMAESAAKRLEHLGKGI